MTSKEKIEALNYIWFYEPTCQEEADKREAIIKELKQDLEILEIFKEQLHISVYKAYFNGKPMHMLKMFEADIFITKEIYDKIKEWLEND